MKSPALKLSPNWKTAVKAWFLAKFGRDASGKITLLGDSIFKLSSTLLVWVQGFRPTFIPASALAKLATAPKLSKAEKYAQKKAQELQEREQSGQAQREAWLEYFDLCYSIEPFASQPFPNLEPDDAYTLMGMPEVQKMIRNYKELSRHTRDRCEVADLADKFQMDIDWIARKITEQKPSKKGF
jgi:hypothetical protein